MQRIKTRRPRVRVPNRWSASAEQHAYYMEHAERQPDPANGGLTGQARLLLLVSGLFGAANALSGTFVNVYLWKFKNDFSLIAWFALTHQIATAVTFWLAGKWVKEHNKMNSLRLGVAVSALFYTLVLAFGPRAVDMVFVLGLVQGMASGFFWVAFNVVYFEVTDPDNRDRFNGWAGLLGSGSGMIAPWISGFLITRMEDVSGYRVIFTISLCIFVGGVVASFFLKKRKVSGSYSWTYGLRKLREPGNPWRRVVPALLSQGMREGVFGFLIGLLVYIATRDEMKLGTYSLITSGVAFFSFMLAGRLLKPHYRSPVMLAGTVMMVLVILPFFWKVSYTTLLLFGIGTSLFIPLYVIPMTSSVFDMIGRDQESARMRVEYVVLRELALCAGRMISTLAFLGVVFWNSSEPVINTLLLVMGSFPILAWVFMRKLLPGQGPGGGGGKGSGDDAWRPAPLDRSSRSPAHAGVRKK